MQSTVEIPTTFQSKDAEEFGYQQLSRSAVVGAVLAALSILSFWFAPLLFLAVCGLIFGIYGSRNISRYPDELTGKAIALGAVLLSGLMLIIAPVHHAYVYATEVPEGYQRISFSELKSPLGAPEIPPKNAYAYDEQKVFLKGYVHLASCASSRVKNFILVPDLGTCCFGTQPPLTHMIEVTLTGDQTIEPSLRKLRLAGTLFVERQLKPLSSVDGVYYQLRVDQIR